MRRLAALVALLGLGLVVPASALEPSPTFFRFNIYSEGTTFSEIYPDSGVFFGAECGGVIRDNSSHPTPYASDGCSYIEINFEEPQHRVSLKIRVSGESSTNGGSIVAQRANDSIADTATVPTPGQGFVARTVSEPNGGATITRVRIQTDQSTIDIDDLAISTVPQPDTEFTSGPDDPTNETTADFTVRTSSHPSRYSCRLDDPGGRLTACPSPISYSDLAEGTHTLEVAAIDEYGVRDRTPAEYTWRIDTTAPGAPTITSGPSGSTEDRTATFSFTSSAKDFESFRCSLDNVPRTPCTSPKGYEVEPGDHTFHVRAVDQAGNLSAATIRRWTVISPPVETPTPSPEPSVVPPPPPPPPPPPGPDRDGDVVLDPVDNCPDAANADQGDRDGDGIGNACEILPQGDQPPVPGASAVVRAVSGEVFVKLPAGSSASVLRRFSEPRLMFIEDGFVPLKGVASVPFGSTVDTQKGQIATTSALNSRPVDDRRRKLQTAVFAAGIFRLRQQAKVRRSGKAASKRIPTDVVLVSPTGAERVCATASGRSGPGKGVVRTLSGSGKGYFRTVGGASTSTAKNATWITSDRCNGTRTEVGRGKVKVRDRRRRKTVTVKPGRAYLAKAPLFRSIKGRTDDGALKGRP